MAETIWSGCQTCLLSVHRNNLMEKKVFLRKVNFYVFFGHWAKSFEPFVEKRFGGVVGTAICSFVGTFRWKIVFLKAMNFFNFFGTLVYLLTFCREECSDVVKPALHVHSILLTEKSWKKLVLLLILETEQKIPGLLSKNSPRGFKNCFFLSIETLR